MVKVEPVAAQERADEDALWQQWLVHKNPTTRTELFFFYSPWIRVLAGHFFSKYAHPLAEWSDYLNLASIGLLQAIDGFDPLRQTRFKAYAEPYIKGGILKGLSCYVRDRLPVSRDRLFSITENNGFGELGVDFEKVVSVAVDLAFGYFLELGVVDQEPVDNNPLSFYLRECGGDGLGQIIDNLSVSEQQVIRGHYYQCLSFVEISKLLGLTKSRVSQIHAKALSRLRKAYENLDNMDSHW